MRPRCSILTGAFDFSGCGDFTSCPPVERAAMSNSDPSAIDRKSTRLNSSHLGISYAVFCLKKKCRTCDGLDLRTGDEDSAVCGVAAETHRGPGSELERGGASAFFFFRNPGPHRFSPLSPPGAPAG